MTRISIQTLELQERTHLDEAVSVLVGSFQDAPQFVNIWPDNARRQRVLPIFLRIALEDAWRHGRVNVALADQRIVGVAAWLPPQREVMTPTRQLRAALPLMRILQVTPRAFPHLTRFGGAINAAHPKVPHWYLVVLGVSAKRQGQGIGSRLVRKGLERAERTGCYLETMLEDNVRLYEKHGFETIRYEELLPNGPPFWFMWRPGEQLSSPLPTTE